MLDSRRSATASANWSAVSPSTWRSVRGASRTTAGTPWVPERTIRTGVCRSGMWHSAVRLDVLVDVFVELVDVHHAVAVLVGVAGKPLIHPVAKQRLLLVVPDLALLLGGRTGQRDHAVELLEGLAQIIRGDSSPVGRVFPLLGTGVARVQDQQLEAGLAAGQFLPQPLDGKARPGEVVRVAVDRRQIHFSGRVPKTVSAEVEQRRVVGTRLFSQADNSVLDAGLQRLAAGRGPLVVGHFPDFESAAVA